MKDIIFLDSQTQFQGGMQNGVDPGHVADHQYYRGINITCRNGVIDSRPSFKKMNLDFSRLNYSQETVEKAEENYSVAVEALEAANEAYEAAIEALADAQAVWDAFIATYEADHSNLTAARDALQSEYNQMLADNIAAPGTWLDEQISAKLFDLEATVAAISALERAYDTNDNNLKTSNAELLLAEAAKTAAADEVTRTSNILDAQFDAEWIYYNGKFQGAEPYNTRTQTYAVTVISGHIFLIDLNSSVVTVLTNKSNKLSELVDRCYLCQAENYFIIQDGIARPKILDGATMRDSDPTNHELPVGKNMAYGQGRLAIQVSHRHFIMGDIFLSTDPSNVLKMKETQFLNEGGDFTVSGALGTIMSLRYANVSDTSTGDGPLLAICENGISTFAVNNPRVNWSSIPIQKEQLYGTGIIGSDAVVNIGEDILYRSPEGIRSYAVGRSEAAGAHKYTEMSREVENYMRSDRKHGAEFLSMAFFDKRLLATTSPVNMKAKMIDWPIRKKEYDDNPTDENLDALYLAEIDDVYFNGIIAYDFSMSGFTKSTSDSQYNRTTSGSYDGIWTGIRSTKLFTVIANGSKMCFSFTKANDGTNQLYEITDDITGYDGNVKIEHALELRAMPFKTPDTYVDCPFVPKHLNELSLWLSGIESEVTVKVYLRSDLLDRFYEIGLLKLLAKTRSADNPKSIGVPQSRPMIKLNMLNEISDDVTKIPIRNGYEFQFRIIWNGRMQFRRLLAEASKIELENMENSETVGKTYPHDDWNQYSFKNDMEE
jgi:hypothetical protein